MRFKEQVITDRDLDFAIYRLDSKVTDRQPLKLSGNAPAEDAALLIIQHPAGEPKQVSVTDCRVKGADLAGISASKTDFGHLCDTLGGSSGSGVLALGSMQVIGLHHLGFPPVGDEPVNQAVKIGPILDFIARQRPALKAELGL